MAQRPARYLTFHCTRLEAYGLLSDELATLAEGCYAIDTWYLLRSDCMLPCCTCPSLSSLPRTMPGSRSISFAKALTASAEKRPRLTNEA